MEGKITAHYSQTLTQQDSHVKDGHFKTPRLLEKVKQSRNGENQIRPSQRSPYFKSFRNTLRVYTVPLGTVILSSQESFKKDLLE